MIGVGVVEVRVVRSGVVVVGVVVGAGIVGAGVVGAGVVGAVFISGPKIIVTSSISHIKLNINKCDLILNPVSQ